MPAATINWQQILPYPDGEVARYCLGLLKKLWSGQISQPEFEKENHYVVIGYPAVLQEMKPKKLPVPPASYVELQERKRKASKPSDFDSQAFVKDHPDIVDYLDREGGVNYLNKTNAEHLEELYEFFSTLGDTLSAAKVRAVYEEYPLSIYNGARPVWMRKKL